MAEIVESLYQRKGDTVFYSRIIKDNPSCYLVSGQIFYDGIGIISQTIDCKENLNIMPEEREKLNAYINSMVSKGYKDELSSYERGLILKVCTKSDRATIMTPIRLFFFRTRLEMSILGRFDNLKIGELNDSDIGPAGVSIFFDVNDWKKSVAEIKGILDQKGLGKRAMIFKKINFRSDDFSYECVYPTYFEGSFMDL